MIRKNTALTLCITLTVLLVGVAGAGTVAAADTAASSPALSGTAENHEPADSGDEVGDDDDSGGTGNLEPLLSGPALDNHEPVDSGGSGGDDDDSGSGCHECVDMSSLDGTAFNNFDAGGGDDDDSSGGVHLPVDESSLDSALFGNLARGGGSGGSSDDGDDDSDSGCHECADMT